MLILGSKLVHLPVMSLQTGTALGQATQPIFDPGNLTLQAYKVEGPLLAVNPSFLRVQDIREVAGIGLIVDDQDELVEVDDIIALKKLYDIGFNLIGLSVIDDRGKKLGKIEDYILETPSFVVQQLQVKRSIFRSLNEGTLLIHRSQVVKITDTEIVVKSAVVKTPDPVVESTRHEFVNPFRQAKPQQQADTQ